MACEKEQRKIADYASESKTRLAILFGSEDRGLENSELDRCRMHLVIDTDSEYPTLNLAAAVQIVCYELRRIALEETALPRRYGNPKRDRPAADDASMEGFYKHLEEHLRRIRFFNPQATGYRDAKNAFDLWQGGIACQ